MTTNNASIIDETQYLPAQYSQFNFFPASLTTKHIFHHSVQNSNTTPIEIRSTYNQDASIILCISHNIEGILKYAM